MSTSPSQTCSYYQLLDRKHGTNPTSPLHHSQKHARGLCKPIKIQAVTPDYPKGICVNTLASSLLRTMDEELENL